MIANIMEEAVFCSKKTPKRILHFSDGTLEEYSTDEEIEETCKQVTAAQMDTKSMDWISWVTYQTINKSYALLAWCDWFGEKLAWGLGITQPKYDDIIRFQQSLAERMKDQDLSLIGDMDDPNTIITEIPMDTFGKMDYISETPTKNGSSPHHNTYPVGDVGTQLFESSNRNPV